jgi:dTDP-4-amino-4,6-dideoxygalactose transaminase
MPSPGVKGTRHLQQPKMRKLPFNIPSVGDRERQHLLEALEDRHLSGDGRFTKLCNREIERLTGAGMALLTHSCTAALEMTAILADIQPGDEVILPSFTFVSTANAFVLRGAVPVFADVREDTINLDERLIEPLVTPRTRAIVPVHYAGVACDMDRICSIARARGLRVIEDTAQGIMSSYRGRPLGSIGDLAALSFHATKNIVSGEGGAVLVNDESLRERAEIIREKGTNRSRFFRGQIDKYTWVDIGSSYLPSEVIASLLWAQLSRAEEITRERLAIWDRYHALFTGLEANGSLRRPVVPAECTHNAHMYYILLPNLETRTRVIERLKQHGVSATFHYVPLHSSPAGMRYGRTPAPCPVSDSVADRLLRLPLWVGITPSEQERIQELVGEGVRGS